MLLALTSLIACSLSARAFQLKPRGGPVSQVTCSSDFAWANNALGRNPCQATADVDAVCNQGNWVINALNSSVQYDPPKGTLATPCTCSWASYNLISACTACQGFANQTASWSQYSFNCAGLLTSDNTYYPGNLTLQGSSIPFWATTNPTTWPNGGKFDVQTAQNINAQGKPDVGPPSASSTANSSKSSPIGAIVGGVVGGVVVLIVAIILGICFIRRNSRLNRNTDLVMANHSHLRSHSEVTGTSGHNLLTPNMSTPLGYSSLSSSPMRPSSPTIQTHASSSIRSFPYFSSGGSTIFAPSVRQQSPPPLSVQRNETTVEPFTLPPINNYDPDRKRASGAYPLYDPPTAPPTVRMEVRSTTPPQGGRTRYNPPAYTAPTSSSPEPAGGSSSRTRSPPAVGHRHGKKGSEDTQHSFTSGSAGNTPQRSTRLVPPAGAANPRDPSANTSTNVIGGRGRQMESSDTDRNRRGTTDDGFSVRDIA